MTNSNDIADDANPNDDTYDHTIHASWLDVFAPMKDDLLALETRLGPNVLPHPNNVYRAFRMNRDDVRVVLIGQDPYPTPGHAIGLSFAAERHVRPIPRSIANMYTELNTDLGITPAEHADLSSWSNAGVMLLNRCLTTAPGQAGAHRGLGWETLSNAAMTHLSTHAARTGQPLVALLLGAQAQSLGPIFTDAGHPVVTAPHPSPLSAHRGFFGSRVFSKVNDALVARGGSPIDWTVR